MLHVYPFFFYVCGVRSGLGVHSVKQARSSSSRWWRQHKTGRCECVWGKFLSAQQNIFSTRFLKLTVITYGSNFWAQSDVHELSVHTGDLGGFITHFPDRLRKSHDVAQILRTPAILPTEQTLRSLIFPVCRSRGTHTTAGCRTTARHIIGQLWDVVFYTPSTSLWIIQTSTPHSSFPVSAGLASSLPLAPWMPLAKINSVHLCVTCPVYCAPSKLWNLLERFIWIVSNDPFLVEVGKEMSEINYCTVYPCLGTLVEVAGGQSRI